jgi:hypothetical protein
MPSKKNLLNTFLELREGDWIDKDDQDLILFFLEEALDLDRADLVEAINKIIREGNKR